MVLAGVAAVALAVPQGAHAQAAGTSYGLAGKCPEYVQPRGTYQYSSGVDEKTITLKVDPDFAAKMKRERFLENLLVTPIYDLVVEAVPT